MAVAFGVGVTRGDAVGVAVAFRTGVTLGDGVGVAVALGVGVTLGDGVGVAVALGVGVFELGLAVGEADDEDCGASDGRGVVGLGFGFGVAEGSGVPLGAGVAGATRAGVGLVFFPGAALRRLCGDGVGVRTKKSLSFFENDSSSS